MTIKVFAARPLLILLVVGLVALAPAALACVETRDCCLPDFTLINSRDALRIQVIDDGNQSISIGPDAQLQEANTALTDAVGDIVAFFRGTAEDDQDSRDSLFCNLVDSTYQAGVQTNYAMRNLGDFGGRCLTSINFEPDTMKRIAALQKIHAMAKAALDPLALPKFQNDPDRPAQFNGESHPVSAWTFNFPSERQTCRVEKIPIFVVDQKWAVLVGPTNVQVDVSLATEQRQYVNTMMVFEQREDNSLAFTGENIEYSISVDNNNFDTDASCETEMGFVAFEKWNNKAGLSSVIDQPALLNPAISQLLDTNAKDEEIQSETLLASNIAILAMPMVVNLVPSSTLRLKTWSSIVIYILVTDFITSLPFIIKGIELILQSTKTSSATVANHYGQGPLEVDLNQHIEVWSVDCEITSSVVPGILFLVFGFLALMIGILIELFTHKKKAVARAAQTVSRGKINFKSLRESETSSELDHSEEPKSGFNASDDEGQPPVTTGSLLPF